jgi:hypothetical protein
MELRSNDGVGDPAHGDEPPVVLLEVVEILEIFRPRATIVSLMTPVIPTVLRALFQDVVGFSRCEVNFMYEENADIDTLALGSRNRRGPGACGMHQRLYKVSSVTGCIPPRLK